jgi:hypothetical protein
MPKASELRTNFTAGELSTLTNSRTQFQRYFNGSETLENWIVLTQGPIVRRKGFKFIAETKDSSKKTRIISFEYSTLQTYAIEIGEGYLRFFSQQGSLLGPTGIILEISNPYLESELFDIKFVQDADVIYMVHPNHPIQKLIRTTSIMFTLNAVDLIRGPYMSENVVSTDLVNITGSTWTEGSTLTLTASGGHTPFTSNHVGGLWRVKKNSDVAHLKITGFTDERVVTVVAQNDIPASLQASTSFNWSEGEFSNARGFPGVVAFHEQRMVLAGTQKIWFSKSNADYENFEVGTNADDPFLITIASQRGDPIKWLFSDQALFVGTAGSIFRIISSRTSPALAPDDIDVKRQISFGCSNVQPELVGQSIIYMQKNNKTARLISFDLDTDKYKAIDITIDSDHVTGEGITSFEYQQIPLTSLWAVRTDGQIAKLTLEQDQEVQAWSRYTTQGSFESIAIVSDVQDNDEIYAIVKRTINGVVKRYVEVQEPNYKIDNLNRFYVDSGLTYNGSQLATLTISGNEFSTGVMSNTLFDISQIDFTASINSNTNIFFITQYPNFLFKGDSEPELVAELPYPVANIVSFSLANEMLVYTDFGGSLRGVSISSLTFVAILGYGATFTTGSIGQEIHQLTGKGRAKITGFTDGKNVTVNIIKAFSATTLLANEWAIAIKNITGLEHLEGKKVSINSDKATSPDKTVNNGAIEIDSAGSIIHIGLPYSSKQKNMPIESLALSSIIGTSQHKVKRIDSVIVRFADTLGGKVIDSDGTETPITSRSLTDNMNEAPSLSNGDEEIILATGWDKLGQIEIVQDGPQPMTIKSITYKVTINDK